MCVCVSVGYPNQTGNRRLQQAEEKAEKVNSEREGKFYFFLHYQLLGEFHLKSTITHTTRNTTDNCTTPKKLLQIVLPKTIINFLKLIVFCRLLRATTVSTAKLKLN